MRSAETYNIKNNEKNYWEKDCNFDWDKMKVVDRKSSLIPRKIMETSH